MDTHRAGQEERLVEVRIGTDVAGRPSGSPVTRHACFGCVVALATAMGLVLVALVAGFVLYYVTFTSPCSQDVRPLSDAAKVNISCTLKKGDEPGSYHIFTVDKTASYLIYGWVKLSSIAEEEVVLKQTDVNNNNEGQNEGTIQRKAADAEIFFFKELLLANGVRISIDFKSAYSDGLFHFYEL